MIFTAVQVSYQLLVGFCSSGAGGAGAESASAVADADSAPGTSASVLTRFESKCKS